MMTQHYALTFPITPSFVLHVTARRSPTEQKRTKTKPTITGAPSEILKICSHEPAETATTRYGGGVPAERKRYRLCHISRRYVWSRRGRAVTCPADQWPWPCTVRHDVLPTGSRQSRYPRPVYMYMALAFSRIAAAVSRISTGKR